MAKKLAKTREANSEADELTTLRTIARYIGVLVRLHLQAQKGDRSQNEMISMLDAMGLGQSEIAELLGTTANTVNVSLYKAKRKAVKG